MHKLICCINLYIFQKRVKLSYIFIFSCLCFVIYLIYDTIGTLLIYKVRSFAIFLWFLCFMDEVMYVVKHHTVKYQYLRIIIVIIYKYYHDDHYGPYIWRIMDCQRTISWDTTSAGPTLGHGLIITSTYNCMMHTSWLHSRFRLLTMEVRDKWLHPVKIICNSLMP